MVQQTQQRPVQYQVADISSATAYGNQFLIQQPYARPAPHLQPSQAVITRIFPYQG